MKGFEAPRVLLIMGRKEGGREVGGKGERVEREAEVVEYAKEKGSENKERKERGKK